jgi:hypothetical protein
MGIIAKLSTTTVSVYLWVTEISVDNSEKKRDSKSLLKRKKKSIRSIMSLSDSL